MGFSSGDFRPMATKLTKRQQHYQTVLSKLEQPSAFAEGLSTLKQALQGVSKFNETIECHIRLGINMKHADQQVRTTVVLPEGTGKTVRVAVVAKEEKVNVAQKAGADVVGSDDLLERTEKENFFEFDVLVAAPDMMVQVGKLGRVLGPKGLMPNPKTGTVSFDVADAIKKLKAGQVEIRPDKQGVVHVPVGKQSFADEQLANNIVALFDTVLRAKPSAAKGTYIQSVYLSSTMGPSIKLDAAKLTAATK